MRTLLLFINISFTVICQAQTCYGSLPVLENFDDQSVVGVCWNVIDTDGDGYNWYWKSYTNYYGGFKCISSNSFTTGSGELFPDNWIISKEIDLGGYSSSDNIELSWKVRGELKGFSHENYSVYVGDSNDVSVLKTSEVTLNEYVDEVGGNGVFVTRTLNISELAGKKVYVAFRHHNSNNQFNINIDDVLISKASASLGITDFNNSNFKQYYNSITHTLKLQSESFLIENISIYNSIGQAILQKQIQKSEDTIDLSYMLSGIYIAKVKINNTYKTFKFIKN